MPGLRDLGRLQPTASVQLAFNLRYRHEGELDRDVLLLGTKGSPLYRHFLTNRQWNAISHRASRPSRPSRPRCAGRDFR